MGGSGGGLGKNALGEKAKMVFHTPKGNFYSILFRTHVGPGTAVLCARAPGGGRSHCESYLFRSGAALHIS